MRLDQHLVKAGLAPTRSKAQQMISDGLVLVDGVPVRKSAFEVGRGAAEVTDHPQYVSRAAYKLKDFLPQLPFTVRGITALDVGASTGGFTQVLLESGVAGVDAVDVGTDQLHPTLREDPRVRSFEQTDIRTFESPYRYDLVVSDVSFIALRHVLPSIDRLGTRWIILLFKPQFEVGREARRNTKGVVLDTKAIAQARDDFESVCRGLGWRLMTQQPASISGKEGNREQCYCFEKG